MDEINHDNRTSFSLSTTSLTHTPFRPISGKAGLADFFKKSPMEDIAENEYKRDRYHATL